MTIREALAEGSAALGGAGIESAALDASLLLAEILAVSRASLIAAGPEPMAETSLAALRSLIKRRLAGESVAYILGKKEFYGLEFIVNPSVLVPRPDTEILVEAVVKELEMRNEKLEKGKGLRVLELCTGSGAVAIALKHTIPELEIWATDISAEALIVAQTNAARLLPPNSIHFSQGDLYDALQEGLGKAIQKHSPLPTCSVHKYLSLVPSPQSPVPIILANPPYIPSAEIAGLAPEVRAEPVLALDGGSDGLDLIRTIIARAPEFLCRNGTLLLEADPRQMPRIASLLAEKGFTHIQTHKDLSGAERVIQGTIIHTPGPSLP
ncbi:MAG: peptide chain release factor N(5)-glutamine methyltransferase [Treponema sp.]|nr:peptide chain release factor N(5)-glutamine methyltransferase [Treponema sp.]